MRPNLTNARQSQNISQQQLAEMVGLKSKASISMLERGLQKGSIELWESIAKALKTPLSELRQENDQAF